MKNKFSLQLKDKQMKHFDTIINNMVKIHKDPKTQYSPTNMFLSKNELSFAISRLMDAQRIFNSEPYDNPQIPTDLFTLWSSLRDKMPSETANDIALCMIKNTPLSSTREQINEVQQMFYKTMNTFTDNTELSKAFTTLFFKQVRSDKVPNMREY